MIKFFRRVILLLWLLAMIVAGVWIAMSNSSSITVVLFTYELPEWSIGQYLIVTLIVGLLLGFFTSYLLTRRNVVTKKRELKKVRKEVDTLRLSQAKD